MMASIGQPALRLEDEKLLRGEGRFIDDITLPGMLEAAFVRSPHAHAAITGIETAAARALPGVVAVLTLDDLLPHAVSDRLVTALPSASYRLNADRPILAGRETVHVGEPVAIVLAQDRYMAEDAAELVEVDYEPLAAVSDCQQALAPGAPPSHSGFAHNLMAEYSVAFGDIEAAFRNARHSLRRQYWISRGGSHSIEGRGVIASYSRQFETLDFWSSTQNPISAQRILCTLLSMSEDSVRVITPDIGGGFGPKLVFYQEDAAAAIASKIIDRPVKWVEDRREHFVATTQERDQYWDMEIAFDDSGRVLGIRGQMIHDHGAYNVRGVNVPVGATSALTLAYDIAACSVDVKVALTNKTPVTPVRGAGQPQGVFVMERLLDEIARALRLGRAEVRARNLIKAEQMPYAKDIRTRGGIQIVLDSGDYPACQEKALQQAGWREFPARKEELRRQGRHIGIGIANYVESTGRGPFENVRLRIGQDGRILLATGAVALGQGLRTMLAQIVEENLPGNIGNIHFSSGDTQAVPDGIGAFNSRQTVMAGNSVHLAAAAMRERLFEVAAPLLQADPADLEIDGANVRSSGGASVSFAELARQVAGIAGFTLPTGRAGLETHGSFVSDPMPYTNGVAIAEVEVDPQIGHVIVRRITMAHDCGTIVNPHMVDGQLYGGIVHGIGNTLYERMIFDDGGQPLTTNLGDYLLVTSTEIPEIELIHFHSPSPLNPLGVKGVGESGVIPIAAAVISAVEDALSEYGVRIDQAPISPPELVTLIEKARQSSPENGF